MAFSHANRSIIFKKDNYRRLLIGLSPFLKVFASCKKFIQPHEKAQGVIRFCEVLYYPKLFRVPPISQPVIRQKWDLFSKCWLLCIVYFISKAWSLASKLMFQMHFIAVQFFCHFRHTFVKYASLSAIIVGQILKMVEILLPFLMHNY